MASRNQYTSTPGYRGGGRPAQQQQRYAPPRKAGVARRPAEAYAARPAGDTVILTLLFIVAPLCGLLGILIPALLWIFVGVTLISIVAMWALNCFEVKGRSFISGVLAVLSVVALISLIDITPKETGYRVYGEGTQTQNTTGGNNENNGNNANNSGGENGNSGGAPLANPSPTAPIRLTAGEIAAGATQVPQGGGIPTLPSPNPDQAVPGATEAPRGNGGPAQEALERFLETWQSQNWEEMVLYTTPSWRKSVTMSPVYMQLYFDYTNLQLNSWQISAEAQGAAADSATLTVIADITKSNKKETLRNKYDAIVFLIDGTWYVDPATMRTGIPLQDTTVSEVSGDTEQTVSNSPTPAPTVNPKTKLWHNDDGGKYYHTEQKCPDIAEKNYKYMKSFTYAELGDKKYKNLLACPTCKAPKRP